MNVDEARTLLWPATIAKRGDKFVAPVRAEDAPTLPGPLTGRRKTKGRKVKPKLAKVAKLAVETGSTAVAKSVFYSKLLKLAEKDRHEGESIEKAFSRIITTDEKGKLIFKGMQFAHGPEIPAFPQTPPPKHQNEFPGPAHAKLHKMAVEHARANPPMTYESAYSTLYAHGDHAQLRAEIRGEHHKAAAARMNAQVA